MSNPNFVSDLVAMAKAFEELPKVQAELEAKTHDHDVAQQMIQRLELRLIDLKTELDAAHAATRKVEVERDHAERMFLETDDRLNAFRRLLGSFQTEAGALIAAAEPEPKPEPEVKPIDNPLYADPQIGDPGPAIGGAFEGQGDVDPTMDTAHSSSQPNLVPSAETLSVESTTSASQPGTADTEVSVQPDPTQATESSSESGLSGSGSQGLRETDPMESGGSPMNTQVNEEAPQERPTDPTAAATPTETGADAASTGASENVTASTPTTTEQPSTSSSANVDDVGYHNEPKIVGTGSDAWHDWDNWCSRMNRKYGGGSWPARPALHGDREAAAQ